ncbi:hypothetical protein [Arcobacter ellisii]|uniref:Uncharacterized protein n=1 Tax=Arcobacter ellisii TaxID=913109 RepID=A0A347UA55_9BACT|nr:hypothetical protein [Arcobacter ellisii]AXX95733.1 hypothetical protein AELL_2091 [Arcobacter ellisii]RXI31395.1 hypothetical protein CP962_04585 [Arcobacter ellisii]
METFTDVMKVVEKSFSEKPTEEYITRKTDIKYQPTITYVYQRNVTADAKKQNKDLIENLVMNLPNRSYQKYIDIEEVEDYDFSNNLVLEMLSRNKIFKKFSRPFLRYNGLTNKNELTKVEKSIEKKYSKLKKMYSQYLGFNMDYYDVLKYTFRGFHTNNFSNNKYKVDAFPRICDIKNGLERAIQFYYEKDLICNLALQNDNILLNDVIEYYSDYMFITEKSNIIEIHKELPISILDNDFISTLSESDLINRIEKIKIGSMFSDLEFIGSKIVNIDLNMNLPLEELIAYVKKIKEEYSKSKSPFEILKNKIEKIDNPKSLGLIPKDNQKRKKTYADAFYIYDLFESIYFYFENIRKDIKDKYKKEKNELKKIKVTDTRKSKIANLTEDYECEIENYNKEALYNTIHHVSGIEINKIKKLHKLLKEYIEELKYKNIIFNKE